MKQSLNPVRLLLQVLAYGLFALMLGYFSTRPAYNALQPGLAVITLSFNHAGEHAEECRLQTQEELSKLAPNMRRPMSCNRERVPVHVEMILDGKTVLDRSYSPTGLAGDGASVIYQKVTVPTGKHHIVIHMRDNRTLKGIDYQKEADIVLHEDQNLVIDFQEKQIGFVFL